MAATPLRPHTLLIDEENNNTKNENNELDIGDSSKKIKISLRSDCQCTNISIMQLFHEMKQEFPKIPDHIVSECVIDNCHNRNACIGKLSKETINLAQIYPTQSLMRNSQALNKNCNKFNECLNNNNNNNNNINNIKTNLNNNETTLVQNNNIIVTNNNNISDNNTSDMPQSMNKNIVKNNRSGQKTITSEHNQTVSTISQPQQQYQQDLQQTNKQKTTSNQRPTTLNLSQEPYNPNAAFSSSTAFRPTRTAPPPPLQSSSQPNSSTSPFQYQQNLQESPSQSNNEAIVSVNVTVSPVSSRPSSRPRHTSALNIQPEPPYFPESPLSARSYTSVHFNLRPPSDNPQTPINITTGPALTYRSSSYNAREGHQTQVQLTIGGGNSAITAMRARPRTQIYSQSISNNELEKMGGYPYNSPEFYHNNPRLEDETIRKQRLRKEKLALELKNDKKHFEMMQLEVRALQSPLPSGGIEQIIAEIKRLEHSCQKMTHEVEEAGYSILDETNEDNNFYQPNKSIHSRPPRPPRPPPPRSISNYSSSGNLLTSPSDVSQTYHNMNNNNPTIYNNNNNSPISNFNNSNYNAEEHWTCSMCTFQNHPLLDKCEQCDNIKNIDNNSGGTGMIAITGSSYTPRLQDSRVLRSPQSGVLTTPASSFAPAINNINNFLVTK